MSANTVSMARAIAKGRALRDELVGTEVLHSNIPMPEFITVTDPDVRRHFASLQNERQREAFLSALLVKLDRSVERWTIFYEAVAVLREHRQYWRKLGYRTFGEFWKDRAGPVFQSLKELEDIYAFAKLACPQFLGNDSRNTRRLRSRLESLGTPYHQREKHVPRGKRLFESKDEARCAIAHAFKWCMVSNRSFEYRLYRIKRDRPDMAAALLAGKYTVRIDSGKFAIDLIQAERDVYGAAYRQPERARAMGANVLRSGVAAGKAEGKRIVEEIDHLARASVQSPELHRMIVERLRAIPWLVQELKESPSESKVDASDV